MTLVQCLTGETVKCIERLQESLAVVVKDQTQSVINKTCDLNRLKLTGDVHCGINGI